MRCFLNHDLDLFWNSEKWRNKGGLGVSSARLLALPAFLASAVGAKDALSEIFGLEHVNGTYDDGLTPWFELGKIEMAPENEIQKKWMEPIFDSEIADLILARTNGRKKIQRVPR